MCALVYSKMTGAGHHIFAHFRMCSSFEEIYCFLFELKRSFINQFEAIFGPHRVVPNMHFHLHIKQTLLDFGTAYSCWAFPYERQISTLVATNLSSISWEKTYMRHINAIDTLSFIQPLRNFVFSAQGKQLYERLLPPRNADETQCNNGRLNGLEVMQFVKMQSTYETRWAGDEAFAGKLLVCLLQCRNCICLHVFMCSCSVPPHAQHPREDLISPFNFCWRGVGRRNHDLSPFPINRRHSWHSVSHITF